MSFLGVFIAWPWLALIPAALFVALNRVAHRRLVSVTALLWFLYAVYEFSMRQRWMCSGECNIRVDLLLLYPFLLLMSVAAASSAFIAWRHSRKV